MNSNIHNPPHHQKTGHLASSTPLPGNHQLLRLHLPQLSHSIAPGQLLSVEDVALPVMRCNRHQQWLELLSSAPQEWALNAALRCEVMGEPFELPSTPAKALLVAEDMGLAPITFLAETLRQERRHSLLVLLGFSGGIPFRPAPSRIMINDLPAGVIATMPLFEDWQVPCRIAHRDEPPGCFGGSVVELARHWLERQGERDVVLYLGGGKKAAAAGASLGREFGLRCQSREL